MADFLQKILLFFQISPPLHLNNTLLNYFLLGDFLRDIDGDGLRDGRHLSYEEYGVSKEIAKHKIIYIHGHHNNKKDAVLTSEGPFEELQICIVGFDRPSYGESDPHPEQTIKSIALDIEELADQLGFGPKFYLMGISSRGAISWGCLKYIPHRLAGAILGAPTVNYWWPSLPSTLVEQALKNEGPWQERSITIAHYTPWLLYWWNTQQIFTQSKSINSNNARYFDDLQDYSTQQGIYESFFRDAMVVHGKWELEPLNLEEPLVDNEGSIHVWQGGMDAGIPISLIHYIVEKLPWIRYHEVPNATHMFGLDNDIKYQMLKALVAQDYDRIESY